MFYCWTLSAIEFSDWAQPEAIRRPIEKLVAGRPAIVISVANSYTGVQLASLCTTNLHHLIKRSTGSQAEMFTIGSVSEEKNKVVAVFETLAPVANFMLRINAGPILDYSPFVFSESVCCRFGVTNFPSC